jgi:hypothetical protein
MMATSVIFKMLPKASNFSTGEKSANLVTLTIALQVDMYEYFSVSKESE